MFSKERSAINPASIKPINKLIATEKPEVAVNNKRHIQLLQQIQASFQVEQKTFDNMVMPLVHKAVKYCQKLPDSSMYYAQPGGLFDFVLNRTEAAMALLQQTLILEKDNKPSEEQRLWQYALFSAAMLQGLGKLYTDYEIDIYDMHGYFIKRWQPLLESIVTAGRYYDYKLLHGNDIDFRNRITPLIARKILPKAGFERIISDQEVFATWLALLNEDKDSVLGPLAAILERANDIAIQRDINNYLAMYASGEGLNKRPMSFVDNNFDRQYKEKILGAEFIVWLTESLENGKIILNKEPLLLEVREASVVLHPSVLDVYMQEHKKLKNRVAMQKAFLAWNMHLLTDAAAQSLGQRSEAGTTKIAVNTAILPEKVLVYNAKNAKITKVSTLELVNNMGAFNRVNPALTKAPISKLDAAGKWISGGENVSQLRNQPRSRL